MWKRLLCVAILVHASFGVRAASGSADAYPSKPLRIIDGFPAGGSADYLARVIGPKLTERFGQPVIVDNRPGAGSNVGARITARANPDGYTLMMAVMTSLTSSPSLYPDLGYDLLKDFSYISRVATGANLLFIHPSIPATSVAELVAYARSKPKAMSYGSAGVGTAGHLAMELLQRRTGMELLHVPYKGVGPSLIALAGGEVQVGLLSVTAAIPMIKTKRLVALAVTTAKRIGALPEVPSVAESGFPGFDVGSNLGLLAPAATPAAVVKLLNAEIRNILQMDDVRTKLAAQGLEAAGNTPDEWKALFAAEVVQWARVIKDANITAN